MPKRKTEELGSLPKSEKVRLNRLYSRRGAAYGSIQNLRGASGLSKKVEKFLKTKTSYTKFGPPIRRFRRLHAFSKCINEILCLDLAFVDKLASQNSGVKYLLVAVDIFSRFVKVQTIKKKYAKDTLQAFRKRISRKTLLKSFGLMKEQNMGEIKKKFARRKTLKFTEAAFAERALQSLNI